MKNKGKIRKAASVFFFLVGLAACSYPLVSGIIQKQYQKNTIATYTDFVKNTDDQKIKSGIRNAREYNDKLYQSKGLLMENTNQLMNHEIYETLLDISGNGIMGTIEIPKIDVSIPIYHGTKEEVLSVGIGHLEGSSLPVGGENTRAILTGHRGLPNAKLFTRLDEMEQGDYFFIHMAKDTLAYQVEDIQVILPEDVEKLKMKAGEDLISLITCTPYGINTHRLVVTGKRVEYKEKEHKAMEKQGMSIREQLFAAIPIFFAAAGLLQIFLRRKNKVVKEDVS